MKPSPRFYFGPDFHHMADITIISFEITYDKLPKASDMPSTKPEQVNQCERAEMISQASFGRLMGDLKPDGKTLCTVIGCDTLAICRIGCGVGHASCEQHAAGADYISPLN